jgi:hypothetical protein
MWGNLWSELRQQEWATCAHNHERLFSTCPHRCSVLRALLSIVATPFSVTPSLRLHGGPGRFVHNALHRNGLGLQGKSGGPYPSHCVCLWEVVPLYTPEYHTVMRSIELVLLHN